MICTFFGHANTPDEVKKSLRFTLIDLIENTPLKCDKNIAETLFLGLVSDSNRFLFNSCTANTFALVSRYMYKYNFNLESLYPKIYNRPINEVRLQGYISLNMKI